MSKKISIDDEYIYESMVKKGVFPEYCDLVITYVKPELETKYKAKYASEDALTEFVNRKIDSYYEAGRVKAHGQKSRAKEGINTLPEEQALVFVKGCYDELGVQLLRQLRRALGESEDFNECQTYLLETVGNEKESFVQEVSNG
jgi:hypothetical protein